ncbi:MAG: histidine ammonia-lyase [Bacteroidales bacterium]
MFRYGIDHLTAGKALDILYGRLKAVIPDETKEKIEKSHLQVLHIANGKDVVYGINTGFGPLCNTIIDSGKTGDLQRNILLSHSVGVGNPIDKELSKLMMILKVHSLAKGFSGISLNVINRVIWHIEKDIIPVVPEQGSVGASGDLAPLAHLFLPLIGEGKVFYKNEIADAGQVLKESGMLPLQLEPKAGLALINGTQFILAHAVKLIDEFYNCLSHADLIAAMMIDGLSGSEMPFSEDLHKTRPYKGNMHVAARVKKFLENSEIIQSHKNCDRVQDPYSLRCIPQVHGTSRNAWLHLKEAVEIELNSVTDNPLVFSNGQTISGGNFHGQPLALPIDYACLAAAEIGNISDRRTYLSLEGKYAGTPKLLVKDTGLNSGFMILQYTSAALVSENKGLCFPASADSIPTSLGQEDHVSMGSIAARKALRVCNNLVKILAVELVCAAQALDFRKPLKSGKTIEETHEYIRTLIAHTTSDRIFAHDIEKAIEIINSRELLKMVSSISNNSFSDYNDFFEIY